MSHLQAKKTDLRKEIQEKTDIYKNLNEKSVIERSIKRLTPCTRSQFKELQEFKKTPNPEKKVWKLWGDKWPAKTKDMFMEVREDEEARDNNVFNYLF